MNKAQLIDAIAGETGSTKADAKRALDAFISATTEALKKKERVALVGFGSFTVVHRKARMARNPRSGGEVAVPARNIVKFKPGSELADAVNN